ncbi:MAG: hypothetical protein IBX72_13860 [Nitrospirae bacterium]|nr:hypothetical protein [Nitrospirota bacterium]
MKRLRISMVNKSSFSIASSRVVGNVQESLDFVPGTTVRGALAETWLKANKPDSDFKEIFTTDKVTFGNLYIRGAKPVPLAAFSCKYYSGFKGDAEKHGAVDILLSLTREKESAIHIPAKYQNCEYIENGRQCSAPMKKYRGYYLKDISDGSLKSVTVGKRLIYHTAVSHTSEAALEGALYSQEIIETGQIFQGEIWVHDDALLTKIENFIRSQEVFFLGSDKSTGLGRFEMLSDPEIVNGFDKESLRERIIQFNERLRLNNGKTYFSITFQSDAVITDKFMRYKSFLEPEDLGIKVADLICGVTDSRLRQGWNAMARLPKEDVIAIEKGSVFVFCADNLDNVLDRLYEAEVAGIGKRKGEGFGRLTVCDLLHLEEGMK